MKNGTYDMREDAKSLGKLQDRLNTPCVKFGKPALKYIVLIKKKLANFQWEMKKISSIWCLRNDEPLKFMSLKMSLDES